MFQLERRKGNEKERESEKEGEREGGVGREVKSLVAVFYHKVSLH